MAAKLGCVTAATLLTFVTVEACEVSRSVQVAAGCIDLPCDYTATKSRLAGAGHYDSVTTGERVEWYVGGDTWWPLAATDGVISRRPVLSGWRPSWRVLFEDRQGERYYLVTNRELWLLVKGESQDAMDRLDALAARYRRNVERERCEAPETAPP